MCAGMWSCAFLIRQTTKEVRFRRKPTENMSRLIWLQPGLQCIGDQSFDPFAYCEDVDKDPAKIWMSSRKDLQANFEIPTTSRVHLSVHRSSRREGLGFSSAAWNYRLYEYSARISSHETI